MCGRVQELRNAVERLWNVMERLWNLVHHSVKRRVAERRPDFRRFLALCTLCNRVSRCDRLIQALSAQCNRRTEVRHLFTLQRQLV
jgi:hypothetical protein